MAEIYNIQMKSKKTSGGWGLIFLLFLSFVWTEIYLGVGSFSYGATIGYGNLFDVSNSNLSQIIMVIVVAAIIDTIMFELISYIYRFVLSFKIYSFIVPAQKVKSELRVFFIYRNLIYGIFVNICFIFPFLYAYLDFISLVVTMTMFIIFVIQLNSKYGENIIGHFIFKCFCYPIFALEGLNIAFSLISKISEVM